MADDIIEYWSNGINRIKSGSLDRGLLHLTIAELIGFNQEIREAIIERYKVIVAEKDGK